LALLVMGTMMIGFGFTWIGISEQQYISNCTGGTTSQSCTQSAHAELNSTWQGQVIIGIGAFVLGGGAAVYFTYLPRRVESALGNVEWDLY
jgi:hypothetical protein